MALEAPYPTPAATTGYVQVQSYPMQEGATAAPLDAQMSMLLGVLTELTQLVDRMEGPAALRAIRPDKPAPAEGLTALVAACHAEAGTLGMSLRNIAERIGRL